MKNIYKVEITHIRDEEGLTDREYLREESAWSEQVACIKRVERTLYTQEVEALDIVAVIGAINKPRQGIL